MLPGKWWNRSRLHTTTTRTRSNARSSKLHICDLEQRTMPAAGLIAVGSDAGQAAVVRIRVDRDANDIYETAAPGSVSRSLDLYPFGAFTGGVRVAMGDFNGDGNDELVTAAGPGGGPHVIIWDMNSDGTVAGVRDSFFAYSAGTKSGLFVSTGDLNNDGRDELVVAPDAGGGPHVKIYSDTNNDGALSDNLVDEFFAYSAGFTGGVRVAMGNTDNTGGEELVTAPGAGGGPHVKVYTDSDADRAVSDQATIEEFFAYDAGFGAGVYVAVGQLENAGGNGAEIITGPGAGGGPHVKIFSDMNSNGKVSDNALFDQFFAYSAAFTGGVRVAAGDIDDSGILMEVLTAPGPGGGQDVKSWDDSPDAGFEVSYDTPISQQPADPILANGSFVAFGKQRTATFARPGFPQAIPEAATLTSSFFVPAGAGVVRDLDIDLNIYHTFNGDLDVTLTHVPSGKSIVLFTDIGGTDEGMLIRLNDEAATDIGMGDNPTDGPLNGSFNPEGAALLSIFDGIDASGEWQLIVTDDTAIGGDVGVLNSWSMEFSW